MATPRLNGGIELICGGMFSGKTEEVIRQVQRGYWSGQNVQIFRATSVPLVVPQSNTLLSHGGSEIQAMYISRSDQILPMLSSTTDIVAIDELQFLDWGVVDVCQHLADHGVRVIASGLDMSFRGEPFGPVPLLMSIADQVRKLRAVCTVCGNPAGRSQRLLRGRFASYNDPVILPGAHLYQPRCRYCHRVPGRD